MQNRNANPNPNTNPNPNLNPNLNADLDPNLNPDAQIPTTARPASLLVALLVLAIYMVQARIKWYGCQLIHACRATNQAKCKRSGML